MRSRVSILTPALTHDLTVLETARIELGLTEPDTSADAYIQTLIQQASSQIASYCNRVFGEETIEETFWPTAWGENADCVVLDRYPITGIADVLLDGRELATGEYDIDDDKGILYLVNAGVPYNFNWFRSITVTYSGGYALLDAVPFALERACLVLIKGQYLAQGRDPTLRSENIPGVYSWAAGSSESYGLKSPDMMAMLAPFRRFPA